MGLFGWGKKKESTDEDEDEDVLKQIYRKDRVIAAKDSEVKGDYADAFAQTVNELERAIQNGGRGSEIPNLEKIRDNFLKTVDSDDQNKELMEDRFNQAINGQRDHQHY
jgi:hypothetical protein